MARRSLCSISLHAENIAMLVINSHCVMIRYICLWIPITFVTTEFNCISRLLQNERVSPSRIFNVYETFGIQCRGKVLTDRKSLENPILLQLRLSKFNAPPYKSYDISDYVQIVSLDTSLINFMLLC